jgi:hypothetical protein
MRDALVLGQSLNRRVPAIGPKAGGVVEGKAEIVAEFGAGYALGLVFVKARGPFAGKVDLSERRKAGEEQKDANCGSISSGHHGAAARTGHDPSSPSFDPRGSFFLFRSCVRLRARSFRPLRKTQKPQGVNGWPLSQ